jgi:hypothetical protein
MRLIPQAPLLLPTQCMIDILSNEVGRVTGVPLPHQQSNYYIKGFDGFPYPMPNDEGLGRPLSKPILLCLVDLIFCVLRTLHVYIASWFTWCLL